MARMVTTQRIAISTVAAWLAGFVIFFPILWMVLTSFKTELEAFATPPSFLFFHWTTENYATVQERSDYLHHALNSIIIAGGSTLIALLIAIPSAWSMAFSPTRRHQGYPALDAVDQDDASGRRPGSDLPDLSQSRPARFARRPRPDPLPRQPADRDLHAVHLLQGDSQGHSGGGADGWRHHRPRAGLRADADGDPGARLDIAAQPDPRLERGVLDLESVDVGGRAADGVHRVLFEPGRLVLGQAVGGIDAGDRADPGARLVQPEAAGPRAHLRRRQVIERTGTWVRSRCRTSKSRSDRSTSSRVPI